VSVRTVFLDAGGVLLNPNWERVGEALARHGVPAPAALLARAEPHAKRELDAPERVATSTDDSRGWLYFNLVLAHAGIPRSEATDAALAELRAYHAERNLWESVPEDVLPALASLRAEGLRLAVVSNANGTLRAHLLRLGLADRFDAVLDSEEEGIEKPDPRFFELALARAGADAATTVHVGDLYHVDVVGARRAGIAPVLIDPASLYPDADCPRFARLSDFAAALLTGSTLPPAPRS
jgi:HAD superfamily hydrolase (TIGR01509 family)